MARKDRYSQDRLDNIAKHKALKTRRRKLRKARNAQLREAGIKFSKNDIAYKG